MLSKTRLIFAGERVKIKQKITKRTSCSVFYFSKQGNSLETFHQDYFFRTFLQEYFENGPHSPDLSFMNYFELSLTESRICFKNGFAEYTGFAL